MEAVGGRESLQVVVLDDDVDVAHAICDLLGMRCHVARAVHDLATAWHALVADGADVLVADYHIGVMTSGLLLAAVRLRYPGMRRLLVSASPPCEWRHLVDGGLVHGALGKPFVVGDLIELVEAVFNGDGVR